TALVESEAEHGVSGLEDRRVRGHVRLRPRVRLHVRVRRTEERLRALDRERLGDVDPLAPAVVATAGIALRVLVREDTARRLHDGGARVVLGGDELDLLDLPAPLALDGVIDLGIHPLDKAAHFVRRPSMSFGSRWSGRGDDSNSRI